MNLFSDSTYKKYFTFYSKAKHYGQKKEKEKHESNIIHLPHIDIKYTKHIIEFKIHRDIDTQRVINFLDFIQK